MTSLQIVKVTNAAKLEWKTIEIYSDLHKFSMFKIKN